MVISGPSGVGKDAVLEQLKQRGKLWHFVVTATTRPPRPGEREGEEYIFLSTASFEAMVSDNQLLEHADVYGHQYGTPREPVEKALRSGKDVVTKTDVQGARTLRSKLPEATLIFIAPPSMEELETRLRDRKANHEIDLQRRLRTAKEEMGCQSEFDHIVVNYSGRLNETVVTIERIIEQTKR